jgi:hypothetical protein
MTASRLDDDDPPEPREVFSFPTARRPYAAMRLRVEAPMEVHFSALLDGMGAVGVVEMYMEEWIPGATTGDEGVLRAPEGQQGGAQGAGGWFGWLSPEVAQSASDLLDWGW